MMDSGSRSIIGRMCMVNKQIFVVLFNIAGIITGRKSRVMHRQSEKYAVLWDKMAWTADTSIVDYHADCIPPDPSIKPLPVCRLSVSATAGMLQHFATIF
jgi:hypothetical protein